MEITSFKDFINEDKNAYKITAGIVLLFNNKILLIHPTNGSWRNNTCGIPKGKVEDGEDVFEAALRELREETGILLEPSLVDPTPNSVDFYQAKRPSGKLVYFVCEISSLDEIGLSDMRLPTSMLQVEEVDWAKFVGRDEAYSLVTSAQLIILDRHLINN
jgi:8-oxo-dGTP pyrophosphatase MutT (NUDIX family)